MYLVRALSSPALHARYQYVTNESACAAGVLLFCERDAAPGHLGAVPLPFPLQGTLLAPPARNLRPYSQQHAGCELVALQRPWSGHERSAGSVLASSWLCNVVNLSTDCCATADWTCAPLQVVFSQAAGPLTWSIPARGNSLGLHSLDKTTSLFMHVSPAIMAWVLRW